MVGESGGGVEVCEDLVARAEIVGDEETSALGEKVLEVGEFLGCEGFLWSEDDDGGLIWVGLVFDEGLLIDGEFALVDIEGGLEFICFVCAYAKGTAAVPVGVVDAEVTGA